MESADKKLNVGNQNVDDFPPITAAVKMGDHCFSAGPATGWLTAQFV